MQVAVRNSDKQQPADPVRAPRLPVISPPSGTADLPSGQEPTPEFLSELAESSRRLETATPQEILRWCVDRYAPRFTMATAFGPEGMTLIHMLAEIAPATPIFNLDTGYQFPETLELRDRVRADMASKWN